jgi:hypothetical protein
VADKREAGLAINVSALADENRRVQALRGLVAPRAADVVPLCRCGHAAVPLDASGAAVAVWGGMADHAPRNELLLITLQPQSAPTALLPALPVAPVPTPPLQLGARPVLHPPPLPENSDVSVPFAVAEATLNATMRALLDDAILTALSASRMADAEAHARTWLARAVVHDHDPREFHFSRVMEVESGKAPRHPGLQLAMRTSRAHNALGLACRHTGRFAEARAEYEAAIALLEACAPPLSDDEAEQLSVYHFNMAQLCRTQAVADQAAFLYHVRKGVQPGSWTDEHWRSRHAAASDAKLLAAYQFGQLDEAALRRDRTADVAHMAERTGCTPPNPPAWVLRTCAACAAQERQPGEFKRCASCGVVVYCGRACQVADWRKQHKAACRGGGAAGQASK